MDFFSQLTQKITAAITSVLTALTISTASPIPTPNTLPSTPPTTQQDSYYSAQNTITYQSYSVSYNFQIPKNGGQITGAFSGTCNGPVDGNYNPSNTPEISGNLTGKCNLGIFNLDIKGLYTGTLNEESKTLTVNYQITSPLQKSGTETILLEN